MIKAVLFDLYNTLAYIDTNKYRDAKAKMAKIAGVPPEAFFNLWRHYSRSINRGDILMVEERVALVLREMGIYHEVKKIRQIADIEYSLQEECVKLGPEVHATLTALKNMGVLLGVISNTGYSTNRVMGILDIASFFEVILLSYEVRSLKPGMKNYNLAINKLGVQPQDCLFVGDGDDNELDGARESGMSTFWFNESRDKILHNRSIQICDYESSHLSQIIKIVTDLRNK